MSVAECKRLVVALGRPAVAQIPGVPLALIGGLVLSFAGAVNMRQTTQRFAYTHTHTHTHARTQNGLQVNQSRLQI